MNPPAEQNHPEQTADEYHLGLIPISCISICLFRTKRLGIISPKSGFVPLFVSKDEWDNWNFSNYTYPEVGSPPTAFSRWEPVQS